MSDPNDTREPGDAIDAAAEEARDFRPDPDHEELSRPQVDKPVDNSCEEDPDSQAERFFTSEVDEDMIANSEREDPSGPVKVDEPDVDPWAVHREHTPEPRTRIVVIGSYDWTAKGAVLELVQDFWNRIDNAPLTVLTGGCPSGPEGIIATLGPQLGIEVEVVRDEEIARSGAVAAFAFIRNESEGATRALGYVRAAGMPVTVLREESYGGNNAWTSR